MSGMYIPSLEELEQSARKYPAIKPAETIAMLRLLKTGDLIQQSINQPLMDRYDISSGKMAVMMNLYQFEEGVAPSFLAERAGVTRATISRMLQRMVRDGLAEETAGTRDRRTKGFRLTEEGRAMMNAIIPDHYSRVSRVIGRLTKEEQGELIRLLEKLEK